MEVLADSVLGYSNPLMALIFFQCCLTLFCEPTFLGFLVISDWGACANLQF